MEKRPAYLDLLGRELALPGAAVRAKAPLVYDLFAGCGGLGLGFEAAGFRTVGFEMLPDACTTYRKNLRAECYQTKLTVHSDLGPPPDVIIGGPPCQPFSVNGYQNGKGDERDGFPAFLAAVERYAPKLAMFENVRGILYRNRAYLNWIKARLESFGYSVEEALLNAVNYGVPQNRERLVVVAHRGDWDYPAARFAHPYTAGEALGPLAQHWSADSKFLTKSMDAYVARYEKISKCIRPRDLNLDEPCRTVTCRNLNGATGDMLRVRLADGRRRRLTLHEGARLQSFPDWFEFAGNTGSQFNQVGNAVPPLMGKALAVSVMKHLVEAAEVPRRRQRVPASLFA